MSEERNDGPVDLKELVRWAEQTQRNLDFLAGQQAQFSTDLQRSREEQEERWVKADARWAETEQGIRALLAIAEIHEREIEALKESQERTGKQLAETGERLAETGGRVDALINTVERLISERRNGAEGREGRGGE